MSIGRSIVSRLSVNVPVILFGAWLVACTDPQSVWAQPSCDHPLLNGNFSSGGASWTVDLGGGDGSVPFVSGVVQINGNDDDSGIARTTRITQCFTSDGLGASSVIQFTLIFYQTFDDRPLSDYPVFILDGLEYGLNVTDVGGVLVGSITSQPGVPGNINNGNIALSPVFFSVPIGACGEHTIGLGVRSRDGLEGRGVAQFDNVTETCSDCSGPFVGGSFDSSNGWITELNGGNGLVEFNGQLEVTGSDDGSGDDINTLVRQCFTGTGDGSTDVFTFDLVSYSSSDTGTFDHPIFVQDGIVYGLNRDGTIVEGLAGDINNGQPLSSPVNFAIRLGPCGQEYEIGLGVRSVDSVGGAGQAVFDSAREQCADCGATPVPLKGDCDFDGDVDLLDFGTFQICFSGQDGGLFTPTCSVADFDDDGDVDLVDFQQFQIAFGTTGGPTALGGGGFPPMVEFVATPSGNVTLFSDLQPVDVQFSAFKCEGPANIVEVLIDPDPAGLIDGDETVVAVGTTALTSATIFGSDLMPGIRYKVAVRVSDGISSDVGFAPGSVRRSTLPPTYWVGAIDPDEGGPQQSFDGFVLEGVNFEDNAGHAFTGGEDFNGDGIDDFLVISRYGKPEFITTTGVGEGEAYLIPGNAVRNSGAFNLNTVGTPFLPGMVFTGIEAFLTIAGENLTLDTHGINNAFTMPDVDNDGVAELVFSLPRVSSIPPGFFGDNIQSFHITRIDQFLAGGVVIVSSTNSLIQSLSGGIIYLNEVGQDFLSRRVAPEPDQGGLCDPDEWFRDVETFVEFTNEQVLGLCIGGPDDGLPCEDSEDCSLPTCIGEIPGFCFSGFTECSCFSDDDCAIDVFGSVCIGGPEQGEACFSDGDCPDGDCLGCVPLLAPITPGACNGGPSEGDACITDFECNGDGLFSIECRQTFCIGGPNDGNFCFDDSDCPEEEEPDKKDPIPVCAPPLMPGQTGEAFVRSHCEGSPAFPDSDGDQDYWRDPRWGFDSRLSESLDVAGITGSICPPARVCPEDGEVFSRQGFYDMDCNPESVEVGSGFFPIEITNADGEIINNDPEEPFGARIMGSTQGDLFGSDFTVVANEFGVNALIAAPGELAFIGATFLNERNYWPSDDWPKPHQYIANDIGFVREFGSTFITDSVASNSVLPVAGESIERVLGIDDFNFDARPDFVLGVPNSVAGGGIADDGAVYIGYRRAFLLEGVYALALLTLDPDDPNRLEGAMIRGIAGGLGRFGEMLAGGVDINGDGRNDVVASAPGVNGGTGEIVAIFASNELVTPLNGLPYDQMAINGQGLRIVGDQAGGRFGFNMISPGDIDGDGTNDLIVSAPDASPMFDPTPDDVTDDATLPGIDLNFDGIKDDVNGLDGRPDGIVDDLDNLTNAGLVYLILGSSDFVNIADENGVIRIADLGKQGFNGAIFVGRRGDRETESGTFAFGDHLGGGFVGDVSTGGNALKAGRDRSLGLGAIGDIDGDGRSDFALGAPLADPRLDAITGLGVKNGGEAYIIYGFTP
jgi:hypothetical protein